jgi:hypothetical protein
MPKSELLNQGRPVNGRLPFDAILTALECEHDAAWDRLETRGLGAVEFGAAELNAAAMIQAIAAIPAQTLAGIKAKAKALSRHTGPTPDGPLLMTTSENEASLAASILRDVIALA